MLPQSLRLPTMMDGIPLSLKPEQILLRLACLSLSVAFATPVRKVTNSYCTTDHLLNSYKSSFK